MDKPEIKEIEVPEWGIKVIVRNLAQSKNASYLRKKIFARYLKITKDFYRYCADVCILGICDEEGNPIFKKNESYKLMKTDWKTLSRIRDEIMAFSNWPEIEEEKGG